MHGVNRDSQVIHGHRDNLREDSNDKLSYGLVILFRQSDHPQVPSSLVTRIIFTAGFYCCIFIFQKVNRTGIVSKRFSILFRSSVESREDEEQSVKLAEILELLLAAGYFRARIKGLSPFDKVLYPTRFSSDTRL
ncbi:hypothetical protein GOODEAATRI_025327 [Goodea atripinnis]|uniref:CCDC93 N-terminal domain-containing protein n=1 Tax=Goodea atripinnis TaxID=208336 RepID=A0ABV0Q0X9_9TELE